MLGSSAHCSNVGLVSALLKPSDNAAANTIIESPIFMPLVLSCPQPVFDRFQEKLQAFLERSGLGSNIHAGFPHLSLESPRGRV
jgi:hypothetical protein